MTAVEDELPLSDTESLGDEPPTVTQQEPTLTQQESEDEVIFDPPEEHIFEEDANSNSGIPHETTAMLTVEIDGVTYKKLGSKKSLSKTSETVLFKKEDRSNLSVDERTILFKSAVAKAHKPYDLMPLSLDDEDKLDDTYNLEVLVSKTKRAHFRYDMYNIFSIIIPNDDESIKEVKDLYSDYSNITIKQVARSNLWYREWMANVYFEQNLELTYDFFQNNVSKDLSMKITETYETFAVGEQGGPLFFILMMNHLLSDTEEAATSLNNRVKKFDIKTVERENIFRVVSLLRGAVKRLQHINKMPEDIVRSLLNVMQTSSVEPFNQQSNHLQKQRKQNPSSARLAPQQLPSVGKTYSCSLRANSATTSTITCCLASTQRELTLSSITVPVRPPKEIPNAGTALLDPIASTNANNPKTNFESKRTKINGWRNLFVTIAITTPLRLTSFAVPRAAKTINAPSTRNPTHSLGMPNAGFPMTVPFPPNSKPPISRLHPLPPAALDPFNPILIGAPSTRCTLDQAEPLYNPIQGPVMP